MKKLIYYTDKEEGVPFKVLNSALMKSELDTLPKGRYKITIEKFHRKATHLQFSYLYGVVYPLFMMAANNMGYEFTSIDELDLWCKQQWANKPIMNRESGEVVNIPQTKSAFVTIDEMAYCNTLRDYCSEYFNVFIPDPDPNYKIKK